MISTKGYAVHSQKDLLNPWTFDRRDVGDNDVLIDIKYCGVCHSDIHQARNEWGNSMYPMVPGHEIVGRVAQAGKKVSSFKVGQLVGVGCLVNSCQNCASCENNQEQFCENGVATYNSYELDKKTLTFGGYSKSIVVNELFVLSISEKLPLEKVAPLLCAGITTWSPIRRHKIGAGHKLGVMGLGGLGHMAVKLGAAMGAEVIVISSSKNKKEDALALGAHKFVLSTDMKEVNSIQHSLDFIIDTISATHDYNLYLKLLKTNGVYIGVGVPTTPVSVNMFSLLSGNKSITASLIGGIKETQEMLDFCASKNITSDVEVISIKEINTAYERMIKNDVKYRFVIDMSTL